jgi:prephenate dehydratase
VITDLDRAVDRSVGYLGPAGTFTHRTVLADPTLAALRHVPCADPGEIVTRLTDGAVTYGVLPWENSVAGLVGPTADLLAGLGPDRIGEQLERGRVRLHRDVVIPVRFQLVGRAGARPEALRTVSSHPHALNQCRAWLAAHAPQASLVAAPSTTAALEVALSDPTGRTAAVTPPTVPSAPGRASRVTVFADNIGESATAETRFIVLGRNEPARTGRERTVVACFQQRDRPGSLMSMLEPFARAAIDLLRIESRPTRDGLGRYYFLIEWRGHPDDARPRAVLRELAARAVQVRVLGTFDEPVPSRPAIPVPRTAR